MSMVVLFPLFLALVIVSAQAARVPSETHGSNQTDSFSTYLVKAIDFLWDPARSGYQHVWPEMKFGWPIIAGTFIASLGGAFGSVGGVGGGGFFVPMLMLVIGFDPKSATAISKCMITGAGISTVYFNLKLKNPTFDIPLIDYNIVLLMLPIIMLGITTGVYFSVVFANWMITVLLILIFIGTSIKAFFKGADTWKMETKVKQESAKLFESSETANGLAGYSLLPAGPQKDTKKTQVSIIGNIYWKEFGLLCFVWLSYVILQIAKTYTATCSVTFWIVNFFQVPVSFGVYLYQAIGLYQGWRAIPSKGEEGTRLPLHHLILAIVCALSAGIIAGLLGVGSGFVMGPLFMELGIAPQVASATATLGMAFSASISVVQYYLLNRFPVPYALYLTTVAAISAYLGQYVIDKLVRLFGRASLIIFVVAFTVFVSAIALGKCPARSGVGVSDMIEKIQQNEYMGFDDFCR
ncbi:sulfite exporter TauE/SafE family protein 3-like isoform X2 [Neltuma alba]|uniref:sulfite exporter TauE/SafE family protein 3-like isoform X2 n=1 Tax=Neltuma alba TaxID=207710 RepID=UPI0010A57D27|nr:sulfite exporter TauE/SafE family protein 3-like isoform X2 [Prosopis alba]